VPDDVIIEVAGGEHRIEAPLTAWTLLDPIEDLERPLPETQARPFGALVAATDFDEIVGDDLWRLCLWLVVTGCSFGAFYGIRSDHAEDLYDWAVVAVELALDGDAEMQRVIAEDWASDLEESGAARFGVGYLSTSHDPDRESLRELLDNPFLTTDPIELAIAVPLDRSSHAALQELLRA
jgi:hypothetical protein